MELLQDTNIWVAISFLIFAIIAFRMGRKSIVPGLDSKIERIRQDISSAENMRVEAQEMLAQYQRKQKEAAKEADSIITRAKENAKSMQTKMEKELEEEARRREAQLDERIRHMEEKARQDIRNYAADLTLRATSEIIAANMNKKENKRLNDDVIQSLSK